MLNCPICEHRLELFREATCRNCGADLGEFYETEARETPEDRAEAERNEAFRMAMFTSTILYAVVMFALIQPAIRGKLVRAFGPSPLGLSPIAFGWALLTLLFLPLPVAFYHFAMVEQRARRDGFNLPGRLGMRERLFYLSDMHHRHPELAITRRICLGSIAYGVIVSVGWIVYAIKVGL